MKTCEITDRGLRTGSKASNTSTDFFYKFLADTIDTCKDTLGKCFLVFF